MRDFHALGERRPMSVGDWLAVGFKKFSTVLVLVAHDASLRRITGFRRVGRITTSERQQGRDDERVPLSLGESVSRERPHALVRDVVGGVPGVLCCVAGVLVGVVGAAVFDGDAGEGCA